MNTLVTIQVKNIGADTNSVNARELHTFIQAKQDFSNWIKNRIKKYGFIENQDYIIVQTKRTGNNATLKEYYITLDMAQELSMVENNEKGREARRWFIAKAKELENPQLTNNQINGYKSQLSQKNKKIRLLEADISAEKQSAIRANTHYCELIESHEDNKLIKELQTEIATLEAKLQNALTPDSIWNLINDGQKYRDLKKQVKEIVPLLK